MIKYIGSGIFDYLPLSSGVLLCQLLRVAFFETIFGVAFDGKSQHTSRYHDDTVIPKLNMILIIKKRKIVF